MPFNAFPQDKPLIQPPTLLFFGHHSWDAIPHFPESRRLSDSEFRGINVQR
jgi:hypothetical protein